MTTIISRVHNAIQVTCDSPEEAKEWFEHAQEILKKMYPDDVQNFDGTVNLEQQPDGNET